MLSVIALRNLLGFCLSSLVVLSGGSQVGVNPRFDDSSLKLSLFGKKIRLACNETFLSIKFCIECSSLLLPEELLAFLNRQTLLTSIFLLPQIATQRFQRRHNSRISILSHEQFQSHKTAQPQKLSKLFNFFNLFNSKSSRIFQIFYSSGYNERKSIFIWKVLDMQFKAIFFSAAVRGIWY